MTTGDYIKKARLERGFSRKMLAMKTGLSLSAIKDLESGRHDGFLSTIVRIADALYVGIDELVGHEVKEAPYGKA